MNQHFKKFVFSMVAGAMAVAPCVVLTACGGDNGNKDLSDAEYQVLYNELNKHNETDNYTVELKNAQGNFRYQVDGGKMIITNLDNNQTSFIWEYNGKIYDVTESGYTESTKYGEGRSYIREFYYKEVNQRIWEGNSRQAKLQDGIYSVEKDGIKVTVQPNVCYTYEKSGETMKVYDFGTTKMDQMPHRIIQIENLHDWRNVLDNNSNLFYDMTESYTIGDTQTTIVYAPQNETVMVDGYTFDNMIVRVEKTTQTGEEDPVTTKHYRWRNYEFNEDSKNGNHFMGQVLTNRGNYGSVNFVDAEALNYSDYNKNFRFDNSIYRTFFDGSICQGVWDEEVLGEHNPKDKGTFTLTTSESKVTFTDGKLVKIEVTNRQGTVLDTFTFTYRSSGYMVPELYLSANTWETDRVKDRYDDKQHWQWAFRVNEPFKNWNTNLENSDSRKWIKINVADHSWDAYHDRCDSCRYVAPSFLDDLEGIYYDFDATTGYAYTVVEGYNWAENTNNKWADENAFKTDFDARNFNHAINTTAEFVFGDRSLIQYVSGQSTTYACYDDTYNNPTAGKMFDMYGGVNGNYWTWHATLSDDESTITIKLHPTGLNDGLTITMTLTRRVAA